MSGAETEHHEAVCTVLKDLFVSASFFIKGSTLTSGCQSLGLEVGKWKLTDTLQKEGFFGITDVLQDFFKTGKIF